MKKQKSLWLARRLFIVFEIDGWPYIKPKSSWLNKRLFQLYVWCDGLFRDKSFRDSLQGLRSRLDEIKNRFEVNNELYLFEICKGKNIDVQICHPYKCNREITEFGFTIYIVFHPDEGKSMRRFDIFKDLLVSKEFMIEYEDNFVACIMYCGSDIDKVNLVTIQLLRSVFEYDENTKIDYLLHQG